MNFRRTTLATALVSALLWTTVALGDNKPLSENAKKHFDAGVAYVDDPSGPKWEEALREFQLAYEDSPTSRLMNNIALCALNLERDGEAIEAYKAYLAGGGESDLKAKQRKQIEKDIATLSASMVKVTLKTVPPDATVVDKRETAKGETITNVYQVKNGSKVIGMHPGLHRIRVEAPGYLPSEWSINAQGATEHSRDFNLQPEKKADDTPAPVKPAIEPSPAVDLKAAPAPKRNMTPVYIGLAATGVFAGAATATGLIAMGKSKDLDKITDASEAEDKKGDVKTWALITDIGIGAAVVSAGVTAYFFFSAPKAAKPEKVGTEKRWQFAPVLTTNVAGAAVYGRF